MTYLTPYFARFFTACSLLSVIKVSLAVALLPVQNGDIIFQTSMSSQSLAIQKATHSPYSHMGIIIFENDEPYVLEAIKTVRYTSLNHWIQKGKNQHFVIKRLKNSDHRLTKQAVEQLHLKANYFKNKPYDLTFEWSDDHLYCSELVWKIYDRVWHVKLAPLQTIAEFDLSAPEVKEKLKERYGDNIPFSELAISPAAIFNSPLLETIISQ